MKCLFCQFVLPGRDAAALEGFTVWARSFSLFQHVSCSHVVAGWRLPLRRWRLPEVLHQTSRDRRAFGWDAMRVLQTSVATRGPACTCTHFLFNAARVESPSGRRASPECLMVVLHAGKALKDTPVIQDVLAAVSNATLQREDLQNRVDQASNAVKTIVRCDH